jgi:hypothetical protein
MLDHKIDKPILTIYTAIFGDYDKLREPLENEISSVQLDDVMKIKLPAGRLRFVCYTDNINLKSDMWEIRYQKPNGKHPRWQAREAKIIGYKDLETTESLWIDGRYEFVKLIKLPKYDNVLFHTHSRRICAYQEAKFCLKHRVGNAIDIQKAVQTMQKAKFPPNFGLWWTGVLWRKHCLETDRFCKKWWAAMLKGSIRDQISLPFALWQSDIKFTNHQLSCKVDDFHSFVKLKAYSHEKLDYH